MVQNYINIEKNQVQSFIYRLVPVPLISVKLHSVVFCESCIHGDQITHYELRGPWISYPIVTRLLSYLRLSPVLEIIVIFAEVWLILGHQTAPNPSITPRVTMCSTVV